MRKYDKIDQELLAWLRTNPKDFTTNQAAEILGVSCLTTHRHISRRFSLLEDRQLLRCTLYGTKRICNVPDPTALPDVLHKGGPNAQLWRQAIIADAVASLPSAPAKAQTSRSFPGTTSEDFVAAGGVIEKLPAHWDHPLDKQPLGPQTFFDQFNDLD